MKIRRYDLTTNTTTLIVPEGAKVLSVQVVGGKLSLWVLEEGGAQALNKTLTFHVVQSENSEVDRNWVYRDTIVVGQFVWHVFQEPVRLTKGEGKPIK